jgi:hypothetical protein
MKSFIFLLTAVITLFFISGCSEKFNVAAPYKNITVVYAFLDRIDTAHYIRIQKAFLDQNKNALVMATTPDSSYYASLNVKIRRIPFSAGTPSDTIHLNRVNLDVEGYPKQPGQFFQSPNYAYKFTNTLSEAYIYRIIITNNITGRTDSADAPVMDDSDPTKFFVDALDASSKPTIDFASTFPGRYLEVQGYYRAESDFLFEGANNPASISQLIVRFNWDDSDIITHLHTPHYFDFNAGFVSTPGGTFDFQIKNTDIYSAISSVSGMGTAPPNTIRLMNRCDVSVYLGTNDFSLYKQSILTQGTGLTGAEIEPVFTNVKGDGALGLYTSRALRTGKATITPATIDSLIISPLVANVNIKGTVY